MEKCNKRAYLTKKEAKIAKRRQENSFGKRLDVYKCTLCPYICYHLTTKNSNDNKIFFREQFIYTNENSNRFMNIKKSTLN